MNAWELNANFVKEIYDCHVDYEERFYLCPDCGEPIYEADWSEESLKEFTCPICENEDIEEQGRKPLFLYYVKFMLMQIGSQVRLTIS